MIKMKQNNDNQKSAKISNLHRQPWSNHKEWKACYDLLFNNSYGAKTNTKITKIEESLDSFAAGLNLDNLHSAKNVLNIWLIRNDSTNHTLITSLLVEEIIKIKEGKYDMNKQGNMPDNNTIYCNDIKNIISQKIIRVTNLLIDDLKKKNRNLNSNMFLVAKEIDLPEFIIEIRHSCTHKDLPSINTLLFVIKYIFFWIKENIWDKQYSLFNKEQDVTEKTLSLINYLNGNMKSKIFESKLYELDALTGENQLSYEVESMCRIIFCFVKNMLNKIIITDTAVLCENLKEFVKIFKYLANIDKKLICVLFFKLISDQIYSLVSEVLREHSKLSLIKEKENIFKKFAFIANFVAQNNNQENKNEEFKSLIMMIHNNFSFCREFSISINEIHNYFNICFRIKPDQEKSKILKSANGNFLSEDYEMESYCDDECEKSKNGNKKTNLNTESTTGSLLFEQLDSLLNKSSSREQGKCDKIKLSSQSERPNKNSNKHSSHSMVSDDKNLIAQNDSNELDNFYLNMYDGLIL